MKSKNLNFAIWLIEDKLCCACYAVSEVECYSSTIQTMPMFPWAIAILAEKSVTINI